MSAPAAGTGVRVLLVATYSQALTAFVAPLARFLEHKGYVPTLAASDEALLGPSTVGQLEADGFRFRVIPFTNRLRPDLDIRAGWRAYRLMRRERFDIVHTFTAKAGFLGRTAAWLARAPIVVHTAFSFPHLDNPERAWLYRPIERMSTRISDHVFCISDLGYRQAQALGASPRHGVSNPGIGLNLDRFERLAVREDARAALGLPAGVPLVGTAARLVPHKRIDLFLDACRRVADRHPEARFVILGDGPGRDALRALSTRLGLDRRLQVVPRLTTEEMPSYFRALDVFVLPTEREGFGMVFVEAMAQETPAIGPRIPPVDGIIDHLTTGVLIDGADPDAYAEAILSLVTDPAKRQALGAAARIRARDKFDERRSFERIEHTYQTLLGVRG